MAKKVLVTGADGFIGSHLVQHLVEQGHDVRAFVLYNSFGTYGWLDTAPPAVQGAVDIFMGDIRDPYGVRKALDGCDAVLHLAALIGIPYSYHSPDTYVDTNIRGTLNVLQAARDLGARVIHTSTSEVYGTARFVPITEEHPLLGQSPYSATKIGADQLALSFHLSFGTPVIVVRPFNTYGPRQSTRAVIPTIITQLAAGQRNLRLGSLAPTRDFNYVQDTVRGFAAALAAGDSAQGSVVNVGSNFEISIGDTVAMIAGIMGAEVDIQEDAGRLRPEKSEVQRLWADNTKARDLLGWTPAYGGLDGLRRGLTETVDWFTNPDNLKTYRPGTYAI